MKRLKLVTIAIVVLALLGVGCYLFLRTAHASYGYTVAAEFASMPADDTQLADWLKDQEGVAAGSVRVARSGRTLKVFFIMSRDLTGHPRFPDLQGVCKNLGYAGQVGAFADYDGADRDTF
jgi:hypothetical protein